MITVSDCAIAYKKLLDVRYEFHLGHKNKFHRLNLSFAQSEFLHLAGLHKLDDIAQLKRLKREVIFQRILSNPHEMESLFAKSRNYPELQERLLPLANLENLLDSEHLIFRFNSNQVPYTKIRADYIISGSLDVARIFIFLVSNLELSKCCSIFRQSAMDYTKNQTKFTILLKRKMRISDGRLLCEYIRPGYQIQSTTFPSNQNAAD